MRLIDADTIIYDEREEGVLSVTEYDIDSMPTIESIPISFLYEYMTLCELVGLYKSKETIECLIDDWREKNGEKDEWWLP